MSYPKISVICPVYKAEKYLHRCVDSILAQTFTDFELLLIDDGSPDRSGKICDEYAAKDSRVRVFHKENGGVTSARREGINNAIGEWITFVDSDDTLPLNALDILLGLSDNANVVVGSIFEDKRMKKYKNAITADLYRKALIQEEISASPCAKLIHRNLFNYSSLDFPREITFGEDLLMNIKIAFCNDLPVKICHNNVYCYTNNKSSCMHTFKMDLDYCKCYFNEKTKCIPSDRSMEYLGSNIKHKLRFLDLAVWGNNYKVDISHTYVLDLKREIKSSHYKVSFYEKQMLNKTTPLVLAVLYWTRRVYQKITNT